MATESILLPGAGREEVDLSALLLGSDPQLQDDNFLSELLASEGDDLLSSLLQPSTLQTVQLSPHHYCSDYAPMTFDLDASQMFPPQQSPTGSDGYTSDTSTLNRAHSPASYSSASDQLGNSPSYTQSPSLPVITSALGEQTSPLLGLGEVSSTTQSPTSDVRIDVESEPRPEGTSERKAATLFLTEEEKRLLVEEGISLPTDMPLTKSEQKHLKRVRRKIKNKISAQESRKRKKEYVEGLEDRVDRCTHTNRQLQKRVDSLESDNRSLLSQLRKLQSLVTQYPPSRLQAGTLVMVVVLSFSFFFMPQLKHRGSEVSYQTVAVYSRTLLFAETDEFGNVIDPETGRVISEAGGQSPAFPPPWIFQTPALPFTNRSGQPRAHEGLWTPEPAIQDTRELLRDQKAKHDL